MRWQYRSTVLFLCMAVCMSRSTEAAPVLIANAGFELPVLADTAFTNEVIADWVVDSPAGSFRAGVFNPPASDIIPSEGENLAYLGPFGETASPISQTLGALLQPSTIYTLQVDVGRRAGSPDAGFGLSLLAGATELASAMNVLALPVGTMTTATLLFESPADLGGLSGPLTIRLFNVAVFGQTNYDNVRLDATPATVPEPVSLFLLGAAAACLLARERRRRTSPGLRA